MNDERKSYPDRLGDGLERVLSDGAEDLATIAAGLNKIGVAGPRGECWDEDLLAAEFKKLADATDDR